MQCYNWLIKYRLYICLAMVLGGLALNLSVSGFWPVFPLYLIGVILIFGHFAGEPPMNIRKALPASDFGSYLSRQFVSRDSTPTNTANRELDVRREAGKSAFSSFATSGSTPVDLAHPIRRFWSSAGAVLRPAGRPQPSRARFDFRACVCQSATMDSPAFGLPAKAPDGPRRSGMISSRSVDLRMRQPQGRLNRPRSPRIVPTS
jgi:hypothetical protein